MKLTRLELSGFKSFADHITLPFEDGVTGIVGPNGCGKSNVSDAVRWVLGEQSARMLRGSRMEEVIFQGTVTRKPVNVAEVSLVFDNNDGQLPIQYNEVVVTRRLTRAGVSEYLINRSPVRLRDIYDLLRGTGLGSNAGVVMEARGIDALLSDKAEERRELFEEAAEIGLYRDRKRSTERRLEETGSDLSRLDDVISEVQTQVRSLARQRGKAERFVKYQEERFNLVAALTKLELEEFREEQQALEASAQELQTHVPKTREALSEADRERERRSQARHTSQARQTAVERELSQVKIELERIEGDLNVGRERLKNAAVRREQALAERQQALDRAERAEREREAAAEEHQAATDEHTAVQGELFSRTSHERGVRERLVKQRALVLQLEEDLRKELETLRALVGERAALERELESLREETAQVASHRGPLERELATAREQGNRAAKEIEKLARGRTEAVATAAQARHTVTDARERETELRADSRTAEDELAQLTARREALSELERQRVGLAPGAQRVLEERERFGGGVLGPLSDFLRVDVQHAEALERLLGDWTNAVLVRDRETAEAIRSWHAEEQPGPLMLLPVSPGPRKISEHSQRTIVQAEGPAAAWAEALISAKEPLDSEGHAFESADGAILLTGTAGAGPIARRAELDHLAEDADRAHTRLRELEGRMAEAADALAHAERHLEEASQAAERARDAEREGTALHDDATRLLEHLQRQWHEVEAHAARLEQRVGEIEDRLAQVEQELHARESERTKVQERIDAERMALENFDAEQESARERRVHWQVEEAQVVARLEAAGQREGRAGAEEQDARSREQSLAQEIAALEAATDEVRGKIAIWEDTLRERQTTLAELDGVTRDAASGVEETEQQLASAEAAVVTAREKLTTLTEEEHRVELARTEIAGRRLAMAERLEVEWHRSLDEIIALDVTVEGDLISLRQENERLRELVEKMGPVNQLAVQEHSEEVTRLEFLTTQRDDLLAAKRSLEQALREIDQTARTLFMETFEQIRANFHQVFTTLFGGGECDVTLGDHGDPLEAPIEIRAAPRGKRIQRVHMLSSGERTLVAVSLLFAIFLTKPSPFCVMDEVDAPLDDANVLRFIRLLNEFKPSTQFVVITHNPRTMQAADAVFGVTMQEAGVSSVVGVRLAEHHAERS